MSKVIIYDLEENIDEDDDDDISLGDHDLHPEPNWSHWPHHVDDDEIESFIQDELLRSEEHLSEHTLDAANNEKIEELLNNESSSIQQDSNESLIINESDKNGTSIYPTDDETFPVQEDIPDDESSTVKEDHVRKEDDNGSNTTEWYRRLHEWKIWKT